MKKILLFLFSLLMSIGAFGDSYTITFGTTASSENSLTSTTRATTIITSGTTYVTEQPFTINNGNCYYGGQTSAYVLRIGKTGESSSLSIALSLSGQISASSIIVNCDNIGGKNNIDAELSVNGSAYQTTKSNNPDNYTFSVNDNITNITLNGTKSIRIYSITVVYGILDKDTVVWIANNDTVYKKALTHNSVADSIPHINIDNYCDEVFFGWTNSHYTGTTPPDVLFTNEKPIITKDTAFYAVFGSTPTYINTNINEIDSGEVIIIVGEKDGNYYAMTNDNGTSNPPVTSEIDVVDNLIFSASVNILWDFSVVDENEYTFYKYNDNTKWLYCTNTNNGVRVGTNANKTFEINNGYLHHLGTSRYVGIYLTQDWRCYTTINDNIKNENFYLFKQISGENDYHTETTCTCEFNDSLGNGLWKSKTNWLNHKIPTIKYTARINKPVTVNIEHAVVKNIIINQNDGTGKITIHPNKGLEVDSTIVVHKENLYTSTTPNDLILESSETGNASLIFNNNNGSQATVCLYSKAYIDRTVTPNKWNWQYIGTPMASVNALYNYYDSWIYEWAKNDGWTPVPNGGTMRPWTGYCITQETPGWYATTGTLIPTDDIKELALTVPAGKDMVFANSWTAPIHISKMVESGFVMNPMTLYLFNTGSAPEGSVQGTEAGTHIVVPIHAAPYLKDTLIAPQQGFFVTNKNGDSEGSITMNYKKLVRCSDSIVAGPMYAPRRVDTTLSKPNVLKIYASGSVYGDDVTILSREDFSTEFDNGWDGEKTSFGKMSPSIYVVNNDGSYDAVSAIPSYEGVLIGFRRGADDAYTLTFGYDGYETLYLNDILTKESTMIDGESRYIFTSGDSEEARFVISSTPYSGVTTNIEDLTKQSCRARKFLYNGNLYIFKNNCIFNIEGSLIQR